MKQYVSGEKNMPLSADRKLTPVTTKAHAHMTKIVAAYKKRGIPDSNTHWLSELILSQQIPNGNGAHWVGKEKPLAVGGQPSAVEGGKS
jgi:hypothetical protein